MGKRKWSHRVRSRSRSPNRGRSHSSSSDSPFEESRYTQRGSTQSTAESLHKFANAITSLLINTNSKQPNFSFKGEVVPAFNPEERIQTAEVWCRKVDELRVVYQWPEETTIYFALSKLQGLAETWYKGLNTVRFTWDEWKRKLQEAFPTTREYFEVLKEMIRRIKQPNESYTKYFYEKMALVNHCEINGANAVSCIIGGIDDRIIKTTAKAGQHETPESLHKYLSAINDHPTNLQTHQSKPVYKRKYKDYERNERNKPIHTNITCFKCGKKGHFANRCLEKQLDKRCKLCGNRNHDESNCFKKMKDDKNKTIACVEIPVNEVANKKYHKNIRINNIPSSAYVDFGSSCTIIIFREAKRLRLVINFEEKITLHGYGNGRTSSIGSVKFKLEIDGVEAQVKAVVVPDFEQNVLVIIGRTFTELPNVIVVKNNTTLKFLNSKYNSDIQDLGKIATQPDTHKIILRTVEEILVPPHHWSAINVISEDYFGDAYLEASIRPHEGHESCIPRVIIRVNDNRSIIPFMNLSDTDMILKEKQIIARAWPCEHEPTTVEKVFTLTGTKFPELNFEEIIVGPVEKEEKQELFKLLSAFRDCLALTTDEIGCAKSAQMQIELNEDKPFSYRPYRMARAEQEAVKNIVDELLSNNIVRESNSNYCSPVLLVKKKNGEQRLCIDYRKLNSQTVKDNHPLPRIDDQIDRLQGGIYFTSLDMRSGYYQVLMKEESKHYTSFVTPSGQYEYNRMPFGLTNAPRTFQRLMNKILAPIDDIAAVYLDDVLLHSRTVSEALNGLRKTLVIFREEGITLNLKKCSFLMTTVTFLGFEISNGGVRPGQDKMKAVENFKVPKSVRHIRQFLGLTGYFRHFVKDYAKLARPLTMLLRKTTCWKWTEIEEKVFRQLQKALVERPVLALFKPDAITEVHTDASAIGLAGILLQYQDDGRIHPVAYFSRQTMDAENKFHSYELETLAVVESLKKFRVYLLGMNFTVITDCNALKTSNDKKQLIPRIARWWLQLQEFTFVVKYRPGNRMKHVDALSRNPLSDEKDCKIMQITQADWVLAGQLTDTKIKQINEILSRPPNTAYEKTIYKNYALRNGRIYRITARGIQWLVPQGMRQQVVRAAHDEYGHFALEKTLYRLCENYWFPRMREYVEKYISCCIRCLYNKRMAGKKQGYLHPIPKDPCPMKTLHVDHLGPFPKSKKGNLHIIAAIDAFTKFAFIRAVKSTKTKYVIDYFKDLFVVYGAPKVIISDQGSSFTSKQFSIFCEQNNIQHVKNAVATPRANGQVERLNRSILSALMTTTLEDERWDENIRQVQFSINNTVNKSTGKTPSVLLFGYTPRGGSDTALKDEVNQLSERITDFVSERDAAADKIVEAQKMQKVNFDRRRKKPRKYKEGDVVLIEKNETAPTLSRKLLPPYSGPLVVKEVLPNDRYIVTDMEGSFRTTRKANYKRVVAVDRMRPWCEPGGVSDATVSESGDDGVVLSPDEDGNTEQLESS